MTWGETLALLRADLRRLMVLEGRPPGLLSLLLCLPRHGVWAVICYRVSSCLHCKRRHLPAKLIQWMCTNFAKTEIHCGARIGPGLVVSDLGGVGIPNFAIIGENCTFLGPALLTIGGIEGIDLSRDRIVLGNGCIIGQGARVLGALRLADGTQVKANSVVITSFEKPGCVVSGIPARRRAVVPLEKVLAWNPLRGTALHAPAPARPSGEGEAA